jgi:hypothetical protein
MQSKKANLAGLAPVRQWTALVCLLLVGVACGVQVLHSHSGDLAGDVKHCAACQVAHAPARVSPIAHFLVPITSTIFVGSSARSGCQQGPDSYPLFCRPPPHSF